MLLFLGRTLHSLHCSFPSVSLPQGSCDYNVAYLHECVNFSPYMCNLYMFTGAGLKEKRGCDITADTVCEPMEGFFCTDLKSGSCAAAQKHRSCEPGQFISKMGTASTDTECSECISGSFSNGTILLQTLIKAGTSSTDVECGEKSSNTTGIVIGVLVFFLVAATIGGGVFLWKYHKNTKPSEMNKCTLKYYFRT
uniref:TNFR-Cys domain-containing protein n=1 Tax=Poecilia mexicana TaxID=48701 RepID=A0A3B3WPJ9_9TELE